MKKLKNEKRVSIKDIAKRANVSIATVSNVINGKGRMSEKTIKIVKEAIKELGYTPNLSARNLKTNRSHLFGIIVPTVKGGKLHDNPFYWKFVSGVEVSVENKEYQVILKGIVEEEESFSFIQERQLDGVIVLGAYDGSKTVQKIKELGIPCVFVDSYLSNSDVFQVLIDDELGGYLATKHLIELGHEKIALLCDDPMVSPVLRKRFEGFKRALKEANISYNDRFFIQIPINAEGGYQGANTVIKKLNDATAIVTFSDITAMGVLKALKAANVSVPKEMSVVGFDGLFFSDYLTPSLTTVYQDIEMKGKIAADLLLRQMKGEEIEERTCILSVQLKKGESTKGASPSVL